MKSDFLVALTQLAAERNLPREVVLSAIEAALASAYRKDGVSTGQDISVKLEPATGEVSVYAVKTVVEEIIEPERQILLKDALVIKENAEIGETIATDSLSHTAGRIAAQTAKQVVAQRLREAERELVYQQYADKEGEVFLVSIQRIEPRQLIVDLGRAEAVLPFFDQGPTERYRPGQKMKVLLQTVQREISGPELIVSRSDNLLLKRLFEMEVPEIYNGAVEIVAIAREPGSRSKVAVRARQDGVDAVGSCVGLRGVRIQNIVNELQGEKIDVVEWDREPSKFIANALSPSQVIRAELDTANQMAVAIVPDRHLSLAIGREGQNARLAAKLTGWTVDIKSNVDVEAQRGETTIIEASEEKVPVVIPETEVPEDVAAAKILQEAETIVEGISVEPVSSEAEVELAVTVVKPSVEDVDARQETGKTSVIEDETVDTTKDDDIIAKDEEETDLESEPVTIDIIPEIHPEEEPAAAVADRSASLRDLPSDIWSLRKRPTAEPGVIRFAEDIAGLKGGVTARRGRQQNRIQDRKPRKRKGKVNRRR